MSERSIKLGKLKPSEFKFGIGNPRKITPEAMESLKRSMLEFGDFGVFVIDEDYNLISGHQRYQVLKEMGKLDIPVDCKMLIGYTEAEKKAINIRANTQSGEWDAEELDRWLEDITAAGFDVDLAGFTHMDEHIIKEERLEEKRESIKPFKKVHVLLSFPPDVFGSIQDELNKLIAIDGVECEIGSN